MSTLAGFVPFLATRIQDAGGNLLVSGTVEVLPTDVLNKPITAAAGGVGGQMSANAPAIYSVSGGALPLGALIADTTQTLPNNICYRITIKNSAGVPLSVLTKVQTAPNTPLNLDIVPPNVAPQAIVVTGPPGPQGPSGLANTTDSVTGVPMKLVVLFGQVTAVAVDALLSVFAPDLDSTSSAIWIIAISSGQMVVLPSIASAAASPTSLVFIEPDTSSRFQLGAQDGEPVLLPYTGTLAGLSYLDFTDIAATTTRFRVYVALVQGVATVQVDPAPTA